MSNWCDQLYALGFNKEKKEDGSARYRLESCNANKSLWTQIVVIPVDYCWQVTYSRSEIQVGIWKEHSIVKKINVCVHSSPLKMIEEINEEKEKKTSFLRKYS